MAFLLIPQSGFIPYSVSASSEASNYEASHVADYTDVTDAYRSEDTSEQTLVLDLGDSAPACVGVFLWDVNFESAFLAGNDTDSWGAPAFPEQELSIIQDAETQVYKGFYPLSGFSYRYLRVRIPNQAATGSEGYFRCCLILPVSQALELPLNPVRGYRHWAAVPGEILEMQGGGRASVNYGLYLQFHAEMQWQSLEVGDIGRYIGYSAAGRGSAFILYENGFNDSGNERTFLGEFEEHFTITHPEDRLHDIESVRFIERVN